MTKKKEAKVDEVAEMEKMARSMIAHHFGSRKPGRVEHMASGLSNTVFAVTHAEGDFIVRISPDPARLNLFIKEQWAQARAREAGIPVPEILEVGNADAGHPFMISRTAAGREATFHEDRPAVIREMGRLAALINGIPTSGFGGTFDWSGNQLSRNETWQDYLVKELRLDSRLETLAKNRVLPAPRIKRLRDVLEAAGAASVKRASTLSHGDIRLKNVMVDEKGAVTAVLDWEDCTSNLAPEWELAASLHDLSIDEKQAFLEGYCISESAMRDAAPLVKAINILNYAPEVARLAEAKDTAGLDRCRTRLSGALDLYSLTDEQ